MPGAVIGPARWALVLSIAALLGGTPRLGWAIEPMRQMRGFPKRLLATELLQIELRYDRGRIAKLGLTRRRLRNPRRFRRFVGRYRADLYAGNERIEVAPFNFPMLGKTQAQNEQEREFQRRLRANLVTRTEVRLPSRKGATHVLIIGPTGKLLLRLDLETTPPTKAHRPAPTKAPEPTPVKAPKPTPVKAPKPAPVKAPKPAPVKAPKPAPTHTKGKEAG
ncbi:MAG: hypothetical protein KC609_06720 [Myxococcales bacterium]|nr:hypothetical protein [Myxococcales bacterium]